MSHYGKHMTIRQLVSTHGLTLPDAPRPVGNYRASCIRGKLLYVSGQLPLSNGELVFTGALGKDLTVEQGQQAAELCALNVLSQIDQALGSHELVSMIKLEGYVNASAHFSEHAAVLNGASDLFYKVLGERSGHIRTAVGCTSLPMNAAVEVSAIAEIG